MKYFLMGIMVLWCGVASADITTVKVQVITKSTIDVNGQKIEYTDAQYLPADAVKPDGTLTKEASDKVVAEETARVARWEDAIKNPPKPKETTKEELQAQLASLEEQKSNLEAQKVEIQTKITAIEAKPINEEPIEEVNP